VNEMSRLTIYRDDYSDATIVSNQFIDEYMENGNIITYKFKENKGEYYFYQSKIEE